MNARPRWIIVFNIASTVLLLGVCGYAIKFNSVVGWRLFLIFMGLSAVPHCVAAIRNPRNMAYFGGKPEVTLAKFDSAPKALATGMRIMWLIFTLLFLGFIFFALLSTWR